MSSTRSSDQALHASAVLMDLDRVNAVYRDAHQRGTVLSLRALAHIVRAACPTATSLILEDSDQGPHLTAVGYHDGRSAIPRNLDLLQEEPDAEDHLELVEQIDSLASNLTELERYAWEAFVETRRGRHFLDLGLVLAYAGDADRIRGHQPTQPIPLQIPAGQMFVWFGQPPVGDEQVLFVLTAAPGGEEPMMRPLMAQDRAFAEGLREHAVGAAEHLGMTAVLREFAMFQVIDTVAPA